MSLNGPEAHVAPSTVAANGAYSVKRHGVTITNCDSEPVQTPGCIQDHGALLVVRPITLEIVQVSENTLALLGKEPAALLGRPLGAALGDDTHAHIQRFLEREGASGDPLYVLTLPSRDGVAPLDVTVHFVDGVVIIELEATGRTDGVEPDYVGLLKKTATRLQAASSVAELSSVLSAEIRAITGFARVMVYRFHPDGHGEVFAESREEAYPPWLGLHYPAEDIPRPAREVFTKIWCRPVPDVSGGLAELVPLTDPSTNQPLTMTRCALRGPSIMYTEYLRNMKVTACLTMPIRHGGELWGLIACHHYVAPRQVSYPVRAACEFVAQVASLQLQATDAREHVLYRLRIESVHNDLVARAALTGGLTTFLDGDPGMLEGLMAGGAALHHDGRWWKVGATPDDAQLDALAEWLEQRPELDPNSRRVYATDALARDYPPGAAFARQASGVLAIALTRGARQLMMWFRPETIRVVDWGGNPNDKPTTHGPNGARLTPRASFELFRESVRERSAPWIAVEVEAAARLRILVMDVILGRAEQLAALNADLVRSNEDLDAFAYAASHDLKEPLRGIRQYTQQLLDDATRSDDEQRRKLDVLLRLTVRMDGLLDSLLDFSRVGRVTLADEDVDIDGVVREALEMIFSRITDTATEIVIQRPLPHIRGDRVRVREIFVNLLSNALKYNAQAQKRVEVGWTAPADGSPEGPTFFVRDNGIGIAEKHHGAVFDMFRRLHGEGEHGGGTGAGLTIVKKLVERHHGRVWIASAPGAGSTFYFTLPGEVPT